MKDQQDLKLLREYVRGLLAEDDGGDVAMDLMAGAVDAAPYGMSYGGKSLFSVFVDPFVDAAKVTLGKTKELAVRTKTLAKVILETVLTTIIPFLTDDYAEIFATEKKQLKEVQSQYKEAYERVMAVFDHHDLKALAFMYDPLAAGAMLTYFGGKAGLKGALGLADVLSGGWLSHNFGGEAPRKKPRYKYASGPGGVEESVQRLDEKVTIDAVKQALEQPQAKEIRDAVQRIVKGSLQEVLKEATTILSAKSIEDVVKLSKGKISQDVLTKLGQIPQDERQKLEQVTLQTIKKASKEFFVKNLEGQVKKALEAGVPQSSGYVRDYSRVINKIKSM